MNKILYISYDGLTDPLGQSQILPYIVGLTKKGFHFFIISSEKKDRYFENKENISQICDQNHISWHPLFYSKRPPIISTVYDIWKIMRKAFFLHNQHKFNIVHCRSYIPSLVGLRLKRKKGIKFIFDMRGFWADERVEGNLWNLKNPFYNTVYHFFKRKEKQFLTNADYTISLTDNGKKEILSWKLKKNPIPIEVIPTCADFDLFDYDKVNTDTENQISRQLGITKDNFVLSYLGSIGTWYMLDEMLLFFKELLKNKQSSKFLFITKDKVATIYEKCNQLDIPLKSVIIHSARRDEVPMYLSVSDLNIFFIRPVFSKKSSSPTKLAEVMGMGIPIICNEGVGDISEIFKESKCGITINKFDVFSYQQAIKNILSMEFNKKSIREYGIKIFNIEDAINSYSQIYRKVLEVNSNLV